MFGYIDAIMLAFALSDCTCELSFFSIQEKILTPTCRKAYSNLKEMQG